MKYDFDRIISREGTFSVKWDSVEKDEIPLWIADMDFATAPAVLEAVQKRAAHGIFGYSDIPDEWAAAYVHWWKTRHDFELEKENLIFCVGVIPAISTAVRKFSTPAEKVVVLTPVYNIFFNSIVNNGRRISDCPLLYEDGKYSIDFDLLEEKLSDPLATMLIFCNPHNPVGKIWTREELSRIGELCKKHHITVVSDEIHCDIVSPGKSYVPFPSPSETCRQISITCIAPTKCFNIAGINTAAVYVPDEALRNRMNRALNTDEVAEPNSFAVTAAVAAFTKGASWLDSLCEYIEENRRFACSFFAWNIPQIKPVSAEATYLLWLDVSALSDDSRALCDFFRRKARVRLAAGAEYGASGESFLRLNLASPRPLLEEALNRMKNSLRDKLSTDTL